MPLTAKQDRFVTEYALDSNGSAAAVRAGYAAGSARQAAHRLLTNNDIAAAIAERTFALAEKVEVNAEWVVTRLRALAVNAAKDSDRIRALELLGKHLAMFTERVHHTASFVRPELAAIPADRLAMLQEMAYPGSTGEPAIEAAVSRLLPAIDSEARVLEEGAGALALPERARGRGGGHRVPPNGTRVRRPCIAPDFGA